jgi:hypothetical protein
MFLKRIFRFNEVTRTVKEGVIIDWLGRGAQRSLLIDVSDYRDGLSNG